MKNKLNTILVASIIGVIATAYAECYTNTVVVCKNAGDLVGNTYEFCSGFTFSYNVYCNEKAYKLGLLSTSTGFNSQSVLGYCDAETVLAGHPNPASGVFKVRWTDPCTGGTSTTDKDGPGQMFNFQFEYDETSAQTCP